MRWYRLLLRLYPSSFRAEYGEEMCAVYAARRARAAHAWDRFLLVLDAAADVLPNAVAVHADVLRQDLRYTLRTLARSWGFALTALLIVALGIGANTAAFSVADFVLLRPLAFQQPLRLVRVWQRASGVEMSPAVFRDWQTQNRSFEAMGAFVSRAANLVGDGEPQRLEGVQATPRLFRVLGMPPLLGRWPTEEQSGDTRSLVISYSLWQGRFGAANDIIGRRFSLDGEPYEVTAVMPRDFLFPNRNVQIWLPMILREEDFEDRSDSYLEVVGRMRAGVTIEEARADLNRIAAQLERTYPSTDDQPLSAVLNPLGRDMTGRARLLLLTLCGAAACILLLACANLANLILARTASREHELAVRSALGAGRDRLVRQMVTESALLTFAGGGLGLVVALAALPLLAALVPSSLPIAQQPTLDLRVLLLAGLFTSLTGFGFGVLPAWRASSASALITLRAGTRAIGAGQRVRSILVSVQVMVSVVLLIAAGLLVRALWRVQQVDPGFRAENVLTLRTALPLPDYDSVARRDQFYGAVLSRLRAQPGVTSAAYTTGLPMVMTGGIWRVEIPGREQGAPSDLSSSRFVTPGFFATLRIPLRAGRDFQEGDRQGQPFVAVVSESFVERYWPGEAGLGKRFRFADAEREIIGVVRDIRVRGLERQNEPQVYMPHSQMIDGQSTWFSPKDLVIRTTLPVAALLPAIRNIVRAADPAQPISDVQLLSEIVAEQTGARAVQLRILGALAAIALLLAAVGIHGLLSFAVARRGREIGVRLALGARPGSVVRMIVREGLLLAIAGLVPGLALAYIAGRSMNALLFGVQPMDPLTWSAAIMVALAMTLLGTLLPTLRAVRTDPLSVMR